MSGSRTPRPSPSWSGAWGVYESSWPCTPDRMYPLRLAPDWREKPDWGSKDLRPLFGSRDQAVGEVWFTSEENTVTNGPWAGRSLEQLMERHGADLMGTAFRPQAL